MELSLCKLDMIIKWRVYSKIHGDICYTNVSVLKFIRTGMPISPFHIHILLFSYGFSTGEQTVELLNIEDDHHQACRQNGMLVFFFFKNVKT